MAIHSSALTPSYARARAMLSWALPGLLCACSSNPSGPTIVPATDGGRDVAVESAVKDGGGVSDTTTSSDAESTKDAGNTDVDVLPIGTATSAPLATCPGDAYTGATCMTVTVSCSGIADDTATLAITQPGGTAVGTVLLMAGGGGTKFFNIPEISGLLAANFRIVEIEWESAWPQATPASALRGACRAGTLSQWIYDNVHGGAEAAKTTGFCGLGLSGGGAFFTYSVAHYGRKSIYDYLEIMSGPSVAKLDFGCDPSLYDGGPRYVCPDLPNAPFAFTPPTTGQIDGMEGTHTCGADAAAPADIAKWTADSIVSPGADYEYPQTGMSFWFCAGTDLNESSGLGSFLVDKVRPLGDAPPVNCFTDCMGENVLGDPSAATASVADMVAGCVANHK